MDNFDIEKLIVSYIENELVQKGSVKEFELENDDLIENGIMDSLGFLDLILYVEERLEIDLDLSNVKPSNLTKVKSLTQIIYKQINE
tara:strand:+ start:331 stop:591 length:261 start_codon:yes stop_codon:yes gene_type:complete